MLQEAVKRAQNGGNMITSTANPQVKNILQLMKKSKARREQGLFVAEGAKMVSEAPADWIYKTYVNRRGLELLGGGKEITAGDNIEVLDDKVFKSVSDTVTPQGILSLIRQPVYSLDAILAVKNPLLLILEDLQDPGNLGTIVRTAEGAGVTGMILTENTVDIFNPKTIRATMGAIFRVPFLYTEHLPFVLAKLKEKQITTFAAHLDGRSDYDREDYTTGTAFMIGNEGNGLSEELSCAADKLIKIPMKGQVESLNAAMAAGILTYEAARQRRS